LTNNPKNKVLGKINLIFPNTLFFGLLGKSYSLISHRLIFPNTLFLGLLVKSYSLISHRLIFPNIKYWGKSIYEKLENKIWLITQKIKYWGKSIYEKLENKIWLITPKIKYWGKYFVFWVISQILFSNFLVGVKPLIHQSELRTYIQKQSFLKKKVPFALLFWKNIKCNDITEIGNWRSIYIRIIWSPNLVAFSIFFSFWGLGLYSSRKRMAWEPSGEISLPSSKKKQY
jgi:hypothetical protein